MLGNLIALGSAIRPVYGEESAVFSIGKYREMHDEDRASLEFTLGAMRETVFFAQHSIGQPVICATPIPIDGPKLVEMVDEELQDPTNPDGGPYTEATQVAFVFLTALKRHEACQ
jgi:hypothetical protein